MDNRQNTGLPPHSATSYEGVSAQPIQPPANLSGAELCRYVLEEAKRRRIHRELEAEKLLRAEREAERAKRERANAELEPLRPKPEPAPEETSAPSETDPTLINEWEI
jgi:hypothetical protein